MAQEFDLSWGMLPIKDRCTLLSSVYGGCPWLLACFRSPTPNWMLSCFTSRGATWSLQLSWWPIQFSQQCQSPLHGFWDSDGWWTLLGLLCLPGGPIVQYVITWCPFLCFTLSDSITATLAFVLFCFVLILAWLIFYCHFTFSLPVSLNWNEVAYKQHIVQSCFFNQFTNFTS